jgi:hypothetical protein
MVRSARFERATVGLEIRCSIQLSYERRLVSIDYKRGSSCQHIRLVTLFLTINTAQSVFQVVGECVHRNQSSEIYYGLVKRCGKLFRRPLRTNGRQLANRRLSELHGNRWFSGMCLRRFLGMDVAMGCGSTIPPRAHGR